MGGWVKSVAVKLFFNFATLNVFHHSPSVVKWLILMPHRKYRVRTSWSVVLLWGVLLVTLLVSSGFLNTHLLDQVDQILNWQEVVSLREWGGLSLYVSPIIILDLSQIYPAAVNVFIPIKLDQWLRTRMDGLAVLYSHSSQTTLSRDHVIVSTQSKNFWKESLSFLKREKSQKQFKESVWFQEHSYLDSDVAIFCAS